MAAMAAALLGCGTSSAMVRVASSPIPGAAPSSTGLTDSIAASLEGIHVDVLGGGDPAPGRTTTVLAHSGTTAVESYWTTDGWCRSRVYSWEVTDVVDATRFTLAYQVEWEDTSCMSHWGDDITLDVTSVRRVGGDTVIEGGYDSVWDEPTVRTVCSRADAGGCAIAARAGIPFP
jgi:surface antigen